MTIGRSARMFLGAIAVLLATSASAAAQTNDEIFPQFQWNFSTPGARANAMGRAFIGMADDATATISNPAGLVSLTRPQVYLEFKSTNLEVDRLAKSDSLTTLNPTTSSADINALSFFSVSMPFKSRFAVGFTVHQFLNYQEEFTLDPRPIPNSPGQFVFFPVTGSADFKGTTFGVTASAVVSPKLNVGVTISANHLDAQALATRNKVLFNPTRDSGIIANQTVTDKTSTVAAFSFGVLYKPSDKISVGLLGAMAPKFKIDEDKLLNPGFDTNTNQPLTGDPDFPKPVTIAVPNRFGVGLAARPTPKWVLAFDAVWIQYSSLTSKENFTLIFNDSDNLFGDEFVTKDVTEMHFGAEYNVRSGNMPIFLRAGVFTNPNHAVKFTGVHDPTSSAIDTIEENVSDEAIYNFLPRDMETRGTIGAGFVFGQRAQLDIAYVVGKELVASTAIRFR